MDDLDMIGIIRPKAKRDYRGILKVLNGEYPTMTMMREATTRQCLQQQCILLETIRREECYCGQLRRRNLMSNYQRTKIDYRESKRIDHKNISAIFIRCFMPSIIFLRRIVYKTMKIVYSFNDEYIDNTVKV